MTNHIVCSWCGEALDEVYAVADGFGAVHEACAKTIALWAETDSDGYKEATPTKTDKQ